MAVSSLLRSAASTRKRVLAQQDAVKAYEFSNSLKTYDQFVDYSNYLNDRAKRASDPSVVLSLRKQSDSAFRGYASNEIQRASIATLEGRGSDIDKYNTLYDFFNKAQDLGQYDLAQSLVLQMDSLRSSIQTQQVAAYQASETLAKTEAARQGSAYSDMASSLEGGLKDLTTIYQKYGQQKYNEAAMKFVDEHRDALKAMGVDVPKDMSTNLGQLISGVVRGIGNYYTLAADATALTDKSASDGYLAKAHDIAYDQREFTTPAGKMSLSQIQQLASAPNAYVESVNKEGNKVMLPSTKWNYVVDGSGKIVPQYSGITTEKQDKKTEDQQKKKLESLGFDNVRWDEGAGNWVVSLGKKERNWFKAGDIGATENGEIRLEPTSTGFQYRDEGNNKLYQIGFDKKGLAGLYNVDPTNGLQHIQGQYGFNMGDNSVTTSRSQVFSQAALAQQSKRAMELSRAVPGSNQIPLFQDSNALARQADPLNVLGHINSMGGGGKPSMAQRAGGGYNFTNAQGAPISALTYAKLTGQSFRGVLSQLRGDSFAQSALQFAGDDGAYNPATVTYDLAKNWQSLTWGNNVNLQTPQVYRTRGAPSPALSNNPVLKRF